MTPYDKETFVSARNEKLSQWSRNLSLLAHLIICDFIKLMVICSKYFCLSSLVSRLFEKNITCVLLLCIPLSLRYLVIDNVWPGIEVLRKWKGHADMSTEGSLVNKYASVTGTKTRVFCDRHFKHSESFFPRMKLWQDSLISFRKILRRPNASKHLKTHYT